MKLKELFLREGDYDRDDTSGWLTDEIEKELYVATTGTIKKNFVGDLIAQSDLRITNDTGKRLRDALLEKVNNGRELKYPISLVFGSLVLQQCSLLSFKNFPTTVRGNVNVWLNHITTLKGVPKIIDGELDLVDNPITSFHDIHKMINEVKKIFVPFAVSECLLGVLKIQNPPLLSTASTDKKHPNYNKLLQAVSIINSHRTNKDIFACQEELIDNNLKDFAEL